MAVTTYTIATFANGVCRAEIDIDRNLRVRKCRVINNSDRPAFIEVSKAGVSAFSRTIPAHTTKASNLPPSIKLKAVPQPNVADDGPISMGDIEIHVGWG